MIYCDHKKTAISSLFFMEQRFEKCLLFEETSKQDNPDLLRVGALKIYCDHELTAMSGLFIPIIVIFTV